MYGPAGTVSSASKEEAQTNTVDSDIKKVVDEWYKINIEDAGYGSAVSDTLFCNDRSTPGKNLTGIDYDTGLGYGLHGTIFGAHVRLGSLNGYTGAAPSFKCPQKNDAFTVNDTNIGNGALTYPIGLITADEVVAAGSGEYGKITNNSYYLTNLINWYWTLTPNGTNGRETGLFVVYNGLLSGWGTIGNGGVSPVINLTNEYANILIGDGTMENPYHAA